MKILVYIHGYPPTHNAGAEWMLYDIVEYLKPRHEIIVLTERADQTFHTGVQVITNQPAHTKTYFSWADAIITHLDYTAKAHNICRVLCKHDLYFVAHNTSRYAIVQGRPKQFNVIYNSNYTASVNYPQRSTVCRPPLIAERYQQPKTGRNAITLVNCWPDKGGVILAELARLMPDREFIGVLGSYGEQHKSYSPNLTYIANSPDIARVYADTQILIQPSLYESYGKAACEAMSSGCAVLCTDTPGLREALDYAGVYVERTAQAYKDAIEDLDIDKQIELGQLRTKELVEQTQTDLEKLENFITCKGI